MPSKSKAQHNFMAAVANNPTFAKKVGVPQSVGKEFSNADEGRKFSKGGDMKSENMMMKKEGRGMAKADLAKHAAMPASKAHKGLKSGGMTKMAAGGATKMGAVKTSSKPDGIAERGLTRAKKPVMKPMARGGKTC